METLVDSVNHVVGGGGCCSASAPWLMDCRAAVADPELDVDAGRTLLLSPWANSLDVGGRCNGAATGCGDGYSLYAEDLSCSSLSSEPPPATPCVVIDWTSSPVVLRRRHLPTGEEGVDVEGGMALDGQKAVGIDSAATSTVVGDDDGGETVSSFSRPESMWLEYLFEWNPLEAELEAMEACEWLREAGFPQYAQMYRDQRFPLDFDSVGRDHSFLGDDALEALFRRLKTLEKCANMKLKTTALSKTTDDSDEEDMCALSDRWRYQRNSHQWSRLNSFTADDNDNNNSSSNDNNNDGQSSNDIIAAVGLSSDGSLRSAVSCDSAIGTSSVTNNNANEHFQQLPNGACGDVGGTLHGGQSPPPVDPTFRPVAATASTEHTADVFSCTSPGLDIRRSPVESLPQTPRDLTLPLHHSQHRQLQAAVSSDSERSSSGGGSSSSASVSPGLRRAAGDRLRGAWHMLKKVENHVLRRGGGGSSRRSGASGETGGIQISGPTVVDSEQMRARMDALRCIDLSPSPPPLSSSTSSSSSGDPATTAAHHFIIGGSPSSPRGYHTLPSPRCSGSSSTPTTSVLTVSELAAALRAAGSSSASNSPSLLSRRRQQPLSLGEVDKEPDQQQPGEDQVTVPDAGATVRMSVYDNVESLPSVDRPLSVDSQTELDAILTALYRDISMLSCSLAVVKEEHTDGETSLCGDENDSTSTSHTTTVIADDSDSISHVDADQSSLGPSIETSTTTDCSRVDHGPCSTVSRLPSTVTAVCGAPSASDHDSLDSATDQQKDDDCWTYPEGELHQRQQQHRERRDSGVGSSLTRSARRQNTAHRIRWHSFAKCHRPSVTTRDEQMSSMSAGQLVILHRLCMLRITAMLEKYSPAHRSGRSWFVPRLMKRAKTPDYTDRNVFAVPLGIIHQRHGQPLPQPILYAMRRLRRSAAESVGIFRKSGVRSRILQLRNELEADADSLDFDTLSEYDVADLLKLYFRELPDCLLTSKLSHVFISIFQHIPTEERHDLLKAAILLLPDGHRETLQSLLLFLGDMAKHAATNQMNARNLAVCFAPSLFHLCGRWKSGSEGGSGSGSRRGSSRRARSQTGMPSEKDLAEQRASHECLTYMITNAKDLFTIPKQMIERCHLSYIERGDPVSLEELCSRHCRGVTTDHTAYVDSCIQGLLKESRDKFKGWVTVSSCGPDVDLAYKKVGDGHPLRLWKFSVEVEAPPVEVLERVLRERHLWDDDIIKWRVVERLDAHTEVFQYVVNAMVPHPTRDFCELRSWRCDLPNSVCVLVSMSVEHRDAPLMGGIRAVTLASRYLVEPCGSGRSRLTHISRVDLRGRTPDWYNSVYGHLFVYYARRIRSSFKSNVADSDVPETNV